VFHGSRSFLFVWVFGDSKGTGRDGLSICVGLTAEYRMHPRVTHWLVRTVVVSAATLLLAGCPSDTIHRTSLENWSHRRIADVGLEVDVPKKTFDFLGSQELHYRSNGLDDATWYIQISFEKVGRSVFDNPDMPSPQNRVMKDPQYVEWLTWLKAYHPDISVYDKLNGQRQYRRDVPLQNEQIVQIHAIYEYRPFTAAEKAADDAAIRRIVASARPTTP
jgi:hypothetical protein